MPSVERSASASDAGKVVLGSVTPRIFTPPLITGPPGPCGCGCALTPDTSDGFDWVEFATHSLRREPYPWQRFAAIHGGELLPDGRPRFEYVYVIVARQNGKTELPIMLSGYWMFVQKVPLILGTSTKLDYSRESWKKLVKLVGKSPDQSVRDQIPKPRWTRDTNGEQECWTRNDSRYKIAASNEEGGRSLTIHKGICDELRQHHDYSAWGAIVPAMEAVWDRQLWSMSNAGSARSIVLNEARAEALEFIKTGVGNWRAGWLEWSAPEGSDPEDVHALAQANPQLNRTIDGESMLLRAATAKRRGGKALVMFQTETMCINVPEDDPAINPTAWTEGKVPGTLDGARDRIALVWDVSLDGEHATLTAAAVLPDGSVRIEPLAAWTFGAPEHGMTVMIKELKEHVRLVKPARFGWLPTGPAATYAAELTAKDSEGKPTRPKWLPRGTRMEEIRGELASVCMGFEEQVRTGRVLHSGDPLQDAHVLGAQKLMMGDRWVFTRRGGGHCDAAYSAAGAVHLARTMPAPVGKPRLVVAE